MQKMILLIVVLLILAAPVAPHDTLISSWWQEVEPQVMRFETLKELADVMPPEGLSDVLIAMNDTLLEFHYIWPPESALPL